MCVLCCKHVLWLEGNGSAYFCFFCLATSTTKCDKLYKNRLMLAYYHRIIVCHRMDAFNHLHHYSISFECVFRFSNLNSKTSTEDGATHIIHCKPIFKVKTEITPQLLISAFTHTIIIISCECRMTAKQSKAKKY